MRWASALSTERSLSMALTEILDGVAEVGEPDLLWLFTSGDHNDDLTALSLELRSAFPDACLMGAASQGVVGAGREVEGSAAVSLTAGHLPGVRFDPFAIDAEAPTRSAERWRADVQADRGVILIADPFSVDAASVLSPLHAAFPDVPIVGGLGSAPPDHAGPRLVADGALHQGGLVGVGISGDVRFTSAVAQGCRPLGSPMFVTRCEGNRIFELDGRPVVDVLREIYSGLGPLDQALFGSALFIGVQMRDQHEYTQGDFLIRNLVGISSDPTALVVAYLPERFQVVQLHVRDEQAARDDLARVLDGVRADPAGALLVSCVGRGAGLFGELDHDSQRFVERFPGAPLGGFFGNGEIGPIQGRPYVHGYTSVFALFEP